MALQEELEWQGNILFRYRGYLPVIILLIGLAIYSHKEANAQNDPANSSDKVHEYICFFISFTGLLIRIYIVGYTPKNTSGRNTKGQIAEELNTTGIYSICRHPLYGANFLMWMGLAMMTESVAFTVIFCLAFWLYYERIMFAEEQFLRKRFGTSYLLCSKKTPAFIPNLRSWKKNTVKFSFKKVVKQEKTGLLALIFVFSLFHVTGKFYSNKPLLPLALFWIVSLFLAFFLYLIIKVVETNTTILDEK